MDQPQAPEPGHWMHEFCAARQGSVGGRSSGKTQFLHIAASEGLFRTVEELLVITEL
jgi:hypothetical protein